MEPRVVIHSDRIHIRDVMEVNKRKVQKRSKLATVTFIIHCLVFRDTLPKPAKRPCHLPGVQYDPAASVPLSCSKYPVTSLSSVSNDETAKELLPIPLDTADAVPCRALRGLKPL